jgi:DNA primase
MYAVHHWRSEDRIVTAGNEELGEILDEIDIESWLDREGIRYRVTRGSRGIQLNVRECPCCGNSHYKVFLNQETGLGNCFSGDCEQTFNKWSFIRHSLGLTNRQVVEHVKEFAREQGWKPRRVKSAAVDLKTNLVLPESVELPIGNKNMKYLNNRGISGEITRYFNLRYSQSGKFSYVGEDEKVRTQSYAKRIIIPVFDLDGDLVSFQGRDITGLAEKKYLFPPGFASTGTHIYNAHNAHGVEDVVIGEGVFDVMAIKIALDGQKELRAITPLGTFGKHLSHGDDASQLAKLVRLREAGLKRVTFMWDGEPKAIEAAIESALLLRKYGFVARVAILPKGRDPNEVPASVVRDAYWKATAINEGSAVRLLLANK